MTVKGASEQRAWQRVKELEAEVERLRAQCARWEKEEIHKASCCLENEEGRKLAEDQLAKVVEAGNEMADWIGSEQHLQVRVWRAAISEKTYPCDKCGKPRTKAEGGTTFTICDECWAAAQPKKRPVSDAPCDVCGYNGPGYYQSETHPCIAAAQPEEE